LGSRPQTAGVSLDRLPGRAQVVLVARYDPGFTIRRVSELVQPTHPDEEPSTHRFFCSDEACQKVTMLSKATG
jgi:hypothetical protein